MNKELQPCEYCGETRPHFAPGGYCVNVIRSQFGETLDNYGTALQEIEDLENTRLIQASEINRLRQSANNFARLLRLAQTYVRGKWITTADEDARRLSVEIGAMLQPYENAQEQAAAPKEEK